MFLSFHLLGADLTLASWAMGEEEEEEETEASSEWTG